MFKLGFTSMVVITIFFAAGFITGYQRAAGYYQFGHEVESLMLPEVEASLREPQVPEIAVIGENIDVDQAEFEEQLVSKVLAEEIPANLTVGELSSDKQQVSSLSENKPVNRYSGKHSYADIDVTGTESQATSAPEKKTGIAAIDIEKVKYSVQVGMFGSLINARNMMEMLQAQQFESYISNYTNDNNEHRYNVRFGYFPDKKTAMAEFNKYKSNIKGDGYLVRFSANKIVNLKQAENTAAEEEKVSNQLISKGEGKPEYIQTPEVTPLEVKLDKLDTLSKVQILTL